MLLKIVPVKMNTILGSVDMMSFGDFITHHNETIKNMVNGNSGRNDSIKVLILPVLSL